MSKYFELAEKIYEALLAKGAGIGNASIPIIIKVLEENEAVEQSGATDGLHSCLCGDRIPFGEYRCSNCREWETARR